MIYSVNYLELTEKINPIVFAKYLSDTHWQQFPRKRKDIKVFQREINGVLHQVTIPMDDTLTDYHEAMLEAVRGVAVAEDKALEQVFLYLLNPNADILKIRVEKRDVETGHILLDDAISIYENVKRLLAAAAMDELRPAAMHLGRPDSSVSSFLSDCRFGQTEVGSYVVSVVCPIAKLDETEYRQLTMFESEEQSNSFTRKVTSRIMRSLSKVKGRIDEGDFDISDDGGDIISTNFYEALLGMELAGEGTKVEFNSCWAPSIPQTEALPDRVAFNHNYFEPISAAVLRIKAKAGRKERIIGRIKKLESTPDVETRVAGKITVAYLDESEKARTAVCELKKDDYDRALEAHEKGQYVVIVGDMTKGRKSYIKCETFAVLE